MMCDAISELDKLTATITTAVERPIMYFPNNTDSSIPRDSLLKLNDDSILHIFSFLHLCDQIRLSQTCSRLNDVGVILFRKVKSVNFNQIGFLTFMDAQMAFKHIGDYVEHIHFYGFNEKLCAEIFVPFCPNLSSLEFCSIDIPYYAYKNLLPVFKQLECITLSWCELSDEIFKILQFCSKLTKLDLSFNKKIHGDGLKTLPNTIMDLNLSYCYNITSASFIKYCQVAKFKKLTIYSIKLNESILKELSKVESLETFIFDVGYYLQDFRTISKIPNLIDLSIRCPAINKLNDQFYEALAIEKSNSLQKLCLDYVELNDFIKQAICQFINLKYLCIFGTADDDILARLVKSNINLTHLGVAYSKNLSDTAVLNLIEKSINIQVVDVTHCQQFDSSFVFDLIEKLKKLTRSIHLELIVGQTRVYCTIEEEPNFMDFKHLLKLYYDKSYSLSNLWEDYSPSIEYEDDKFVDIFRRV